jgi:hypothetical protein
MNEKDRAGLTIFCGRFGCGKTETALNYAVLLASGGRLVFMGQESESHPSSLNSRPPTSANAGRAPEFALQPPTSNAPILIDLDIVTPYFRSREKAEALWDRGVEVIAPSLIGRHLDTPAITPQILGAIQQLDRPVVLDVGGDRQGARALGQYGAAIRQRRHVMHFVVNPYRPFTDTLPGLTRSIKEIESSSRLRVNSLVSNPNLMGETTKETIMEGHARIEAYAQELDLPIAFVCIEQRWSTQLRTDGVGLWPFAQPVLPLKRNFVMAWE